MEENQYRLRRIKELAAKKQRTSYFEGLKVIEMLEQNIRYLKM